MFLIYLPVLLIIIYYVLYSYFTRTYKYWEKRNVVGPKPVAIFGNLKEEVFRQKYMGTVFREFYKMFPNEKVFGIYRMTTPCLVIRDLDVIKHVMLKDFDFFDHRGISFSNKGLGNNMFHADAETGNILRSKFNPLFTPGKLKNMFPLINERAEVFIDYLTKQCQKNPEFEVHSLVQKYTISSIFACAFGIDMNDFYTEGNETLKTVDKLINTRSYAMELDMMYPGLLKKLNLSLFPAQITSFFENLVTDIMTQRNGKPSTRGDFMDLIINMRQMGAISNLKNKDKNENKSIEITNEIITAQAFAFYTGGYETSATTIAYLLYNLAIRPDIQEKLRMEIVTVMEAYNGEITYEALNKMKYLEQTFSETLRMHPVLDPLQREVNVDYRIPGTDVVIEKGTIVLVPVEGIHYDEEYYPNPEEFDPDRFSTELAAARHSCAFLPFGIGPRNCIGLRFGAIQSRICVAKILSKCRVETCSNTKKPKADPYRIMIGPTDGIFLNILPRECL